MLPYRVMLPGLLLSLICLPVVAADDEAAVLLDEAWKSARLNDSSTAVQLATKAIRVGTTDATAYYLRGREYFRIGKIDESLADFDRYAKLRPDQASRLWERGISCYYAGRFKDGAKQFNDYQSFRSNDVENAVWQLLCGARVVGLEKARADMLTIKSDPRVPMMKIWQLFRGTAQTEDVLAAARQYNPTATQLKRRMFYAHLYIGLYFEMVNKHQLARQHLIKAAEEYRIDHYMGDVARVHVDRLRSTRQKEETSSQMKGSSRRAPQAGFPVAKAGPLMAASGFRRRDGAAAEVSFTALS